MLRNLWIENRPAMVALGALVLAVLSSIVVVPETEQAVVVRLGDPDRVINRFRPEYRIRQHRRRAKLAHPVP